MGPKSLYHWYLYGGVPGVSLETLAVNVADCPTATVLAVGEIWAANFNCAWTLDRKKIAVNIKTIAIVERACLFWSFILNPSKSSGLILCSYLV